MKDWRFVPTESSRLGDIQDADGKTVARALWRSEAERILALRDSHAELIPALRETAKALNMARAIMSSKEARDLAGELIDNALAVLKRAEQLTKDK